MNYPEGCVSSRQHMEYLYRAQEELRIIHNTFVKWKNEGLTEEEYNQLPQILRDAYDYQDQISYDTLKTFIQTEFRNASNNIANEICSCREELKQSSEWPIDKEEIFEEPT